MLNRADIFGSLTWIVRRLSIAFPEPLTVEAFGRREVVGYGYGGFAESWTSRGESCAMCGNCCRRPGDANSWVQLWLPGQPVPDGVEQQSELSAYLNGQRVWFTAGACTFLRDNRCTIHTGHGFPFGCLNGPHVVPIYSPHTKRLWMHRRDSPRNWRWPHCPISIPSVPFNELAHHANLRYIALLRGFAAAFDLDAAMQLQRATELFEAPPIECKGRVTFPL